MESFKLRGFIGLCVAALFTAPAFVLLSARPAAAEEKVQKSELAKHMELMDSAMKKLKRTLRNTDSKDESLELIAKFQQEAIVCKSMVPTRISKIPAPNRARPLAEYRKAMAT